MALYLAITILSLVQPPSESADLLRFDSLESTFTYSTAMNLAPQPAPAQKKNSIYLSLPVTSFVEEAEIDFGGGFVESGDVDYSGVSIGWIHKVDARNAFELVFSSEEWDNLDTTTLGIGYRAFFNGQASTPFQPYGSVKLILGDTDFSFPGVSSDTLVGIGAAIGAQYVLPQGLYFDGGLAWETSWFDVSDEFDSAEVELTHLSLKFGVGFSF